MTESNDTRDDGSPIGDSPNPDTAPAPHGEASNDVSDPAPTTATPSTYAPPTSDYSPRTPAQAPPTPPTPGLVPPVAVRPGGYGQQPHVGQQAAYAQQTPLTQQTPTQQTPAQPAQAHPTQVHPAQHHPAQAQQTPAQPTQAQSTQAPPPPPPPPPSTPAQGVLGQPAAPTVTRRGSRVGIIAALAVGALVGGVSGAGVAALAISSNEPPSSQAGAGPANITVNDATNATTITAVAASAGPSVVTISVADDASGSGGTGSGVILTDDGYILTNTHVVTLDGASSAPTVSVQTSDGRRYTADIVGTDPIVDLAVIKVDAGSIFQPAEFANSSDLNVGDVTIAIGAPLGLANSVTSGIVSSLNRSITVASSAAPDTQEAPDPNNNGSQGPFDFWQNGQGSTPSQASSTIALTVIQTDAAINPGNSGGPLLDSEGKVIGINVAIANAGSGDSTSQSGSIGLGFAVPSDLAERIANEIIDSGSGSHGLLGATVSDAAVDSDVAGASIQTVSPSGAADSAGLKAGDVITAIDDVPVTGRNDLTAQVRALAGGADATITYVRGSDSSTVDVTLGTLE